GIGLPKLCHTCRSSLVKSTDRYTVLLLCYDCTILSEVHIANRETYPRQLSTYAVPEATNKMLCRGRPSKSSAANMPREFFEGRRLQLLALSGLDPEVSCTGLQRHCT